MFISYAQYAEDVMLYRALKNIKNGFYIDVGANDPEELSVTKAFYDMGWSGINIEPVEEYYEKLCKDRERDINLKVAAGATNDILRIYEIPETGLTTLKKDIAAKHASTGWTVNEREVKVQTLTDICNQYVSGEIHFLKIDVEGFELEVIRGMDFHLFRPWILVIETMEPLSGRGQENFKARFSGASVLKENSYQPVYFDGCNTFYLAGERWDDLKDYFKSPPNYDFDKFDTNERIKLRKRIDELEGNISRLEANASKQEDELAKKDEEIAKLEEEAGRWKSAYYTIEQSRSWKITKPFRFVMRYSRR